MSKHKYSCYFDLIIRRVTTLCRKINEEECKILSLQEINDYFTFTVPGHTFMPSFRQKIWDGKIRLYNVFTKLLYIGLLEYLCKFAISRNYPIKFLSDKVQS